MSNRLDTGSARLSLVVTCLLLVPPAPLYPWETPGLDKWSDRELLRGIEFEGYAVLVRRGEKAFPTFEAILADKKATRSEVSRTLNVIAGVKADRRRFHGHAIRFLEHKDPQVRWGSLELLEQIGTEKDAPKLYAMMTDPELVVRYAAPKTIAAIGGPRDLAKLDALLKGDTYKNSAHYRAHLEKYRDVLKKRLDALEEAKKRDKTEPDPTPEFIKEVSGLSNWEDVEDRLDGLKRLNELGAAKVYPALEAILAKPADDGDEVRRALAVAYEMKGDRSRFVEPAVRALAHPHPSVRRNAARLLGEIGTAKDASPLVALLSDSDDPCVNSAIMALAAIGGPREVVALDVWLVGSSQGAKDKVLRPRGKKYRDELEQRLAKEKKAAKEKR